MRPERQDGGPVAALTNQLDAAFAPATPEPPRDHGPANLDDGTPLAPLGTTAARGSIIAGSVCLFLAAFGAAVPLSEALILDGRVVAEGLVKTVQSAENGIVRSIEVAENETVAAGAALVVIENGETNARRRRVQSELGFVKASKLRATSELDLIETGSVAAPSGRMETSFSPMLSRQAALQQRILAARAAAHEGAQAARREVLASQQAAIAGIESQRLAAETQVESLEGELADLRRAFSIGVASRREVTAVERGLVAQRGVVAALDAELARAQQAIVEAELALSRGETKFQERALRELTELEQREGVLSGQARLANEATERMTLRAPVSGAVQNVGVRTVGAVVRAGDPILEIVPEGGGPIVLARVAPGDIEGVQVGAVVEVQVTSSLQRDAAPLTGRVLSVSPETEGTERTGEEWFTARIGLEEDAARDQLRPGMQAQVFVRGRERTLLGYLIEPIRDALNATMRER